MTRSESKSARSWAIQVVHIADPDITSPASLALLAKKYFSMDKNIYTNFRMQRIRRKWIKKLMETPDEKGGLTCAICGNKGLQVKDSSRLKSATLDHIVDIANGGAWNDPSNFQVACYLCNAAKSNRK